jgi:hypothetical protein
MKYQEIVQIPLDERCFDKIAAETCRPDRPADWGGVVAWLKPTLFLTARSHK